MSVMSRFVRLACLALLVSMGIVATAGVAQAEKVCTQRKVGNKIVWECVETDPGGTDPGGETGGPVQPPCDLEAPFDDLCIGSDACWMNDPAAVQNPDELADVPKPKDDSYVVYISCRRADGSTYDRWYWSDDVPTITMEDRIRSAVGALDLPAIEASFNPPGRTLVNLPTWWWAEGAPAGEIRGDEALGMTAVATPQGLTINPGDGSGSITCPMSVTKSDTCATRYRRSGDYTASMSIVYDVVFTMDGQVIDASQIPADLRTLTVEDDVPVAVREVQTRVTKVR